MKHKPHKYDNVIACSLALSLTLSHSTEFLMGFISRTDRHAELGGTKSRSHLHCRVRMQVRSHIFKSFHKSSSPSTWPDC